MRYLNKRKVNKSNKMFSMFFSIFIHIYMLTNFFTTVSIYLHRFMIIKFLFLLAKYYAFPIILIIVKDNL